MSKKIYYSRGIDSFTLPSPALLFNNQTEAYLEKNLEVLFNTPERLGFLFQLLRHNVGKKDANVLRKLVELIVGGRFKSEVNDSKTMITYTFKTYDTGYLESMYRQGWNGLKITTKKNGEIKYVMEYDTEFIPNMIWRIPTLTQEELFRIIDSFYCLRGIFLEEGSNALNQFSMLLLGHKVN